MLILAKTYIWPDINKVDFSKLFELLDNNLITAAVLLLIIAATIPYIFY